MSLIRKHVAVLQAWACLDLVNTIQPVFHQVIGSEILIVNYFFLRANYNP